MGIVMQLINPSGGQTLGISTFSTNGKTNFAANLNTSIGTVSSGYVNAKFNERDDNSSRQWYSA